MQRPGGLRGAFTALLTACIAIAGVPLLATSAPRAHADAALDAYYSQSLVWENCEGGLQCAWLTVPLDYARPGERTIALRVSRKAAPAPTRTGSLVVNPGGPGASGLQMPAYLSSELDAAVRNAYDIVGFDPRGVGESAPITCLTGRGTTRWLEADSAPVTLQGQQRYMALGRQISEGCLARDADLARNIGSDWTVRDLDILRSALGDEKLNWFGYSYGTFLGALFTEAFPDRVGRFVLDGAVDPALDNMELSEGQSRGFQDALARFAADCSRSPKCPIPGSKRAVVRGINTLLADIREQPLPAHPGRLRIGPALSAFFYSLYSPRLWPWLRQAIGEARRGDGSGLVDLADASSARIGRNSYATNMASAFPAIACWDSPGAPGISGLRQAARTWALTAAVPELARSMAWGNSPCSSWFGHSPRGATPVTSTTTAPILIVGTTHDPATPYAWARSLTAQLPTSRLLTYEGDGHTAYGNGSACIDKAIEAYLVSGTLPAPGTRCR